MVQIRLKFPTLLCTLLLLTVNLACTGEEKAEQIDSYSRSNSAPTENSNYAAPAESLPDKGDVNYTHRILIVGDSLSAAYGIAQSQGWVSLLEKRLHSENYDYQVVNTSISGETTAGALKRFQGELDRYPPDIVVIELGGNDGLRGTPLKIIKKQLQELIDLSVEADAQVLLLAMRIPPNYGPRYSEQFNQNYHQLAKSNDIPLVPFFLANIATKQHLMQADGIHPKAAAQREMLDQVWPFLTPLL